jgi:hypothetical protein
MDWILLVLWFGFCRATAYFRGAGMFRVRRLSGVRGFGIGGVLAGPTFAGSAWEGAVERRGIGWCGARRESQGPPSTGRLSASRERGLAFGVERTRAGLRRQESASWALVSTERGLGFGVERTRAGLRRQESAGWPSPSRERGLGFGVERTRAGLRRQESASWHAGMFGAKTGAGEMGNFNGGVQAAHGRGFGRRG